ncbi:FAD-dependent oxidoreductase [Solirubrobacter phytolaccae]|uniref:FAD-dependent oxidoreductase n=1 Tax=Solirubrobacter phytolaccae TaxID=1404360 RepID=A0A9X3S9R0_9ACTN|nr:FAD-dependent oxidoreductase [Solirubrobacter phytolaccae]MDA0179510.1 FAD-dependent oxidoreductase [Solirubrobacter phytolaccae]
MTASRPRRVAILGGGIAGLTAAWELTRPELGGRFQVTVYERDWRLGGKGASSRGVHGRIEEHGLHVWLGYYDNAFRLLREVYAELDRERTDPGCPIAGWRDAFIASSEVGAADRTPEGWSHWVASFTGNAHEPGVEGGATGPLAVATFVERGLRLLADFAASVRAEPSPVAAGVVLSASPHPPRQAAPDDFASVLRQAEIATLIGAVQSLRLLRAGVPADSALGARLLEFLDRTRVELLDRIRRDDDARRTWQLADLLLACLSGIVSGGLLGNPAAFAAIDRWDFRDWLARHGADRETLDSPLVRVMYDFVFAYEGGDPARPRFSAGLGVFLSYKLFFEFRGAIFWKMRAGMGDVVMAPLYQALRARGVRFAFAHRVQRLHVDRARRRIAAVSLVRHAAGLDLEPLVHVRGLPCFPSRPLPRPRESARLVAGDDYDVVVLAAALGALPEICAELIEDSPDWQAMTMLLGTVATRSLQVWTRAGEEELGWRHPGATVAGYAVPFEVYASMTHTLETEDWPDADRPRSVGYFCGVIDDRLGKQSARRRAHDDADAFLRGPVGRYWPGYREPDLVSRYTRVNVEPTERYVQSLPGTARWRLSADTSGYENLVLAGDWIDNGHNAGCVEAAVLSGLEAANTVRGRGLMEGVLGSWSRA